MVSIEKLRSVMRTVNARIEEHGEEATCHAMFDELCAAEPALGALLKEIVEKSPLRIREHLAPGTTDEHLDVIRGSLIGVIVLVASCYQ